MENYDLSGILCWFQRIMMDETEFISYLLASINKFMSEIVEKSINTSEAELFAIMLGVIKSILWYINYPDEKAAEIADKFYEWLNESSADISIITEQFCEYLKSGKLKLKELGEYESDKTCNDTIF